MKKRYFATLAVSTALAFALSACGDDVDVDNEGPGNDVPPVTSVEPDVTIAPTTAPTTAP